MLPLDSNGEHQPTKDYHVYAKNHRPAMLYPKYISDKPFVRASIIDTIVREVVEEEHVRELFDLALTSIIVPISNVRYGPGFGVQKPIDDIDVLALFRKKITRMIGDIENFVKFRDVPSYAQLGDTRHLSSYFEPDSVSLMITSPPYPGDHEYTKHTRLELIFRGYATNHEEFRVIKKRMIRASTTNIYKNDYDRRNILNMESIRHITHLIQKRLDDDGATSGFEGLYTKLVWEYFGGMYKALHECWKVLKPGGKICLLVSDSHAFKMVHIQTASILQEIGLQLGYVEPQIILWQLKRSSSHRYYMRENILILKKPV